MRIIAPLATHSARALASLLPACLWRVAPVPDERVAYLTFDDGPTPSMTRPLLNLLARYDAQATFFLIGSHAEAHPSLVRAIAQAGHTIGNHTFTHPYPWKTPAARLQAELDRTSTLLADQIGHPIRYVRPPYGQLNGALLEWCTTRAHRPVMWDVMPGDFLHAVDAVHVERFVQRHLRPGSVVVLHDNPICEADTLPALRRLLPRLTEAGWRLEAL